MTRSFTALPVEQGDAFLYHVQGRNFLVDGGRGETAILRALRTHQRSLRVIHAAICTHNDADHADGILGVLRHWSGQVREVWVPGTWVAQPQLLTDPEKFYEGVVTEIAEAGAQVQEIRGEKGDAVSSKVRTKDSDQRLYAALGNVEMPDAQEEPLDVILGGDGPGDWADSLPAHAPCWWHSFWTPQQAAVLMQAVEVAERIRQIISIAWHRGIRVRLFDYGEFSSRGKPAGGEPGILEPVNAVEALPSRRDCLSALDFLRLTTSNRESLVFYAAPGSEEHGALFTADSDLQFKWTLAAAPDALLVTAPHHGSESNYRAYQQVQRWAGSASVTWIRSDGRYRNRPGKTFKTLATRVCTICNPHVPPKQIVRMRSGQGKWVVAPGTQSCRCT